MDVPIDCCPVCINNFNKRRVKVTCPKCQNDCCRDCFQTFIKNTVGEIYCMHCKHPLDYDFIQQNTTKTFMKDDYKVHLENILLDKEKSLLSETIHEIENEIAADKIRKEYSKLDKINSYEIAYVDCEKSIINNKIRQLQLQAHIKQISYDEEIKALRAEFNKLNTKINELFQKSEQLELELELELSKIGSNIESKERKKFIKPCPAEDCRGLLSTQYVCGICSTKVCPDCLEIKKDKEHTCKPENVATAKLIKESTKPCPKCGVLIHRIDGCSHLFCIECKTAFDYITGKIHTNGNSNPLYWQWRQSQGDAPVGHQECPEMTVPRMNHITMALEIVDYNMAAYIQSLVDFGIHLRDYEMPRLEIDYIEYNRDLRKNYLQKIISEDEWKIQLQRRYKDSIKRKDIRNVYQIFVVETFGILFKLTEHYRNINNGKPIPLTTLREAAPSLNKFFEEYEVVREYCNNQLLAISKKYNCVRYYITKFNGRINVRNYDDIPKWGDEY